MMRFCRVILSMVLCRLILSIVVLLQIISPVFWMVCLIRILIQSMNLSILNYMVLLMVLINGCLISISWTLVSNIKSILMAKYEEKFDFIEPQLNECDSTSFITEESKVYAAFRLSKFFKIRLEISIFGRPFYVRTLNPLSKLKSE